MRGDWALTGYRGCYRIAQGINACIANSGNKPLQLQLGWGRYVSSGLVGLWGCRGLLAKHSRQPPPLQTRNLWKLRA